MAMTTTFNATSVLCMLGLAIAISSNGAAVLVNAVVCTGGSSLTQAEANTLVNSIRQLGVEGEQCCQMSCEGPNDYADLVHIPVGTLTGVARICRACQGCTSCAIAGSALNDILSQCVATIGSVEVVAGYEVADGFTFVLTADY